MSDKERFQNCRKRLWALLEKHMFDFHKSYEGALEVTCEYTNYFEAKSDCDPPCNYVITLHCYLLINGRHESFSGKTFGEAIGKFEKWLSEKET